MTAHRRPAGVGGCQLDGAGGDQLGRDDGCLGVGGNLVLVIDPEADLDSIRLRFNAFDAPHPDTEDADLIAFEQAVGVVEVRHEVESVERGDHPGLHQHACGQNQDQRYGDTDPGFA
jgi:hypothetical protein